MPRNLVSTLDAKLHEVTLVLELLNISVTKRTPQNRVSDTTTHVTLNTIKGVVELGTFYCRRNFRWYGMG